MTYDVKLEVFEGPIDLLLHLISRQRVDIYDVSLATITEEYLGAIDGMENLDLEAATGFLVVAATLLELKSARLLPRTDADEVDPRLLEERDLLLAKLVELSTFREAGAWIAARLAEGAAYHERLAALEEPFASLAPDPLDSLRLADVVAAGERVFAPRDEPVLDMSHVAPIRESVRDAIVDVAGRLRSSQVATLGELCAPGASKLQVVVRFLALLELFKAGAIDLFQGDRFGDIRASWTDDVDLDQVIGDADEYAA